MPVIRTLDSPHFRLLGGTRVLEQEQGVGRTVLEFVAREEQCHEGGAVQGGFVTGWIDSAMAMAAMCLRSPDDGLWFATLEVKISFYRPATPGTYRAEGWVERSGKSVAFLAGRLLDADGQVIATGTSTGTWAGKKRKKTEG